MPDITGRLRPPRLSNAPTSPAFGEIYYDLTLNKLFWWNGTAWIDSTGGGGGGSSPGSSAAAKLYLASGWTIPTAWDNTLVPFNVTAYDAGLNVNIGSSSYTCPATGYYNVHGQMTLNGGIQGMNTYSLFLIKNGNSNPNASGLGVNQNIGLVMQIADVIRCNQSDVLQLGVLSPVGGDGVANQAWATFLTIFQL